MSIAATGLPQYAWSLALAVAAAVLASIGFFTAKIMVRHRGISKVGYPPECLPVKPAPKGHLPDADEEMVHDAVEEITSAVVQEGDDVFVVSSLIEMPKGAIKLPTDSQAIRSLAGMAARAATAALSIPGRRIELVYKLEVAKALKDGSAVLMKTKNGELLTTARNLATGKVMGKARLIKGGQLAQAGAMGFQVVSMLVAQQHMDDIKKMFDSLQDSVESIKDMLEADVKAEIVGTLNHLKKIYSLMASGEMSIEAAGLHLNYMQGVIAKTSIWQERIFTDIANVIEKLSNVKSGEWFGTGDTHTKISSRINAARPPIERWRTLVELCSLLNFHSEMLGGIEKGYVSASPDFERMARLASDMVSVTNAKTKSLIDGHLLNTQATLDQRRKSLMDDSSHADTVNQETEVSFVLRRRKMRSLRVSMNEEQRFIVDLDQDGNYIEAYMVSPIVADLRRL